MRSRQGITFTVDAEEHTAIACAAYNGGQTVADYLRSLVSASIQRPIKSMPPDRPPIDESLRINIDTGVLLALGKAASRRRIKPERLIEKLIETIADDNLFAAVLDDEEPVSTQPLASF